MTIQGSQPRRALPPEAEEPTDGGVALWIPLLGTLAAAVLLVMAWGFWGPRDSSVGLPSLLPYPTQSSPDGGKPAASEEDPPENGSSEATQSSKSGDGAPALVELNDTSITVPAHWEMYSDEEIEDDRRIVRLQDPETNVRYQVVSLSGAETSLGASCRALVQSQKQSYEVSAERLVTSVGVDSSLGQGVTCGFSGAQEEGGLDHTIVYTLVKRNSDDHVLMLRQIVPTLLPDDAAARRQLSGLSCEASSGFEVPLPLC